MATSDRFEYVKKVVGGRRSDVDPVTSDLDDIPVRVNSKGEVIVAAAVGSTQDTNLLEIAGTAVLEGGVAGSLGVGGLADQDDPASGNPNPVGVEAADFDGAALPNAVDAEGDIVRPKASLSGVQFVMPVNEDGSATPLAPEGTVAGEGLQISLDDGTDTVFAQGDVSGNARVVGSVAHDAVDSGDPVKIGLFARDTLPTAVAEDDRVNAIADLYGRIRNIDAAFSQLNQANSTTRENPDFSQIEGDPLFDVTNGESAANPTVYDYYFSPDQFGKTYLSWRLDGGTDGGGDTGITMTIAMTAQDDGTAKESCEYDDVTLALTGSATVVAAPAGSNDDYVVDNGGVLGLALWVRVRISVSADTTTADWTMYKRQRYI